MKKTFLTVLTLAASAALATPYWASIESVNYEYDLTPSTSAASSYKAYYCTAEAAVKMFGAATRSTIEFDLRWRFDVYANILATSGNATALTSSSWSDIGQYTFKTYLDSAIVDGDYFGILIYSSGEDKAYRVFDTTSAYISDEGQLAFDDSFADEGSYGPWLQMIPEPTSGMLMLLGFACLSLRRRRNG